MKKKVQSYWAAKKISSTKKEKLYCGGWDGYWFQHWVRWKGCFEGGGSERGTQSGPGNESLKHYYNPTPVLNRSKQKCWEFQCQSCALYIQFGDASTEKNLLLVPTNSTHTIARTINRPDITFDMEPKLPKLQNLAGHAVDCKGKSTEKIQDGPTSKEAFKLKKSAELMDSQGRKAESRNCCHIFRILAYLCSMDHWWESSMDDWRSPNASGAIQISQNYIPASFWHNSSKPICPHIPRASWKGHAGIYSKSTFQSAWIRSD